MINMNKIIIILNQVLFLLLSMALFSVTCKTNRIVAETDQVQQIITNESGEGTSLSVTLIRGESHNHPLMAIWVEDMDGNYLQTLYVAKSIAKGVYDHGATDKGKWLPGAIRRPAALPYWGHKRGVQAEDGLFLPSQQDPIADAYTGATPPGSFILQTKTDKKLPQCFKVLVEINQTWDFNEYWTNNKYPDDDEYKTSCQPSLIYAVSVDTESEHKSFNLEPVGHGHYSGKTGELFTDLSTLTTALHIAERITVVLQ
jgi:hypothetical protein